MTCNDCVCWVNNTCINADSKLYSVRVKADSEACEEYIGEDEADDGK